MIKKIAVDYNATTGEVTEREMTNEEVADLENFQTEIDNNLAFRESALSKLSALGLTDEEITSLIK
jgi:hypothetical protein